MALKVIFAKVTVAHDQSSYYAYTIKAGIQCFGPSKAAAHMEGSKTFAKDFMARHHIPTARYKNFSDYESGKAYLDAISHKVVIKGSGLAGGKGVLMPSTNEEAQNALKSLMLSKDFGSAGDEVVIEEYLEGDELSFLSFTDGFTIRSLPPAQDHKQVFDNDEGPNTGGMGCYAPAPLATPDLIEEVHRTILQPTVDWMRKEGSPCHVVSHCERFAERNTGFPMVGLLFTGIMVTKDGPKTLEYNIRFGDPETQTLLPLLDEDTDLAEIILACTERRLDSISLNFGFKRQYSATVVAAAQGYPGRFDKGHIINLAEPPSHTAFFHAGTSLDSEQLRSSGGRVIAVTSTAPTLKGAISRAYDGMSLIHFPHMHYRRDIGHRALKAASQSGEESDLSTALLHTQESNDLEAKLKK